MARGHARAPSQNAFRGAVGRTQTAVVHVTSPAGDLVPATVYTSIDAVSDPELARRLQADDASRGLNVSGDRYIAVPVVYHDPAAELMALVLDESLRHRELDERIHLYERLRADDAPIPAYAKDFAVVFGAAGLRAYLETRAAVALSQVTAQRAQEATKELERKQEDFAKAQGELVKAKQDLAAAQAELARGRTEVVAAKQKLVDEKQRLTEERQKLADDRQKLADDRAKIAKDRAEAEGAIAEHRARVIKAAQQSSDKTVVAPPPDERGQSFDPPADDDEPSGLLTSPVEKLEPETKQLHVRAPRAAIPSITATAAAAAAAGPRGDESAPPDRDFQGSPVNFEEALTSESIIPQGADPLTTDTAELGPAATDPWLDFAATGVTSSFEVGGGVVRLALVAPEQVARGLRGGLDLRVLLHRLPHYPIVSLVIGPPAAMRVPSPSQLAIVPLDVGTDLDRQVLAALAQRFELEVAVIQRGVPVRRVRLTAPLEANAGYILTAAEEHLRAVTADGDASYARARDAVLAEHFDLLGVEHPEAAEFRDDKLAQLSSAHHLRRAIAVARRFAKPVREDYLVCARGFPLKRWSALRRHVLESAIEWGLWMGSELAQLAVTEGLAPSRKDLVLRLDTAFEALRSNPTAFDLDDDAADDNVKALTEEARAYGVELHRKSANAIKSEDVPEVSGSIDGEPESLLSATTPEQLMAMLDDKHQRVSAAAELCDRGVGKAAPAVIAAVKKMSRSEAVRILGKSVKLGAAAAPPLIEGLRSSKAFLRHGCALALALLRTDEGTRAIVELLLQEPTEVWREVSRALGQVGPKAIEALASRVVQIDVEPPLRERVAWAMAHVGARGGKAALEELAAGEGAVAPLARDALELVDAAARDEVRVRPGGAPKDVTVNRAFSRRFFEALDVSDKAALDFSSPMELLDEADLIVDEEDSEAELDEADLIQT